MCKNGILSLHLPVYSRPLPGHFIETFDPREYMRIINAELPLTYTYNKR